MDIDKITKGFWQTKTHLYSAILGAAGWDVVVTDAELASGPQVYVYAFDLPSKFIWMASVPREAFIEMSTRASQEKNLQIVRNAVQHMFFHSVAGGLEKLKEPEWEVKLAASLVAYAGTTQTWVQADKMKDGGHFIILNYRRTVKDEGASLRPFAMIDANNAPLESDKLIEIIHEIVEIDRARHPEWFNVK